MILEEVIKHYQENGIECERETCNGCAFFTKECGKCNSNLNVTGYCLPYQRKDGNGVIFVKTENMEERIIKLSLEKAKEFYKKGGEFKDLALSAFSEKERKEALPNTWEKFCSTHEIKIGEYYINVNSEIMPINHIASRHKESDRNMFCNRQAAVAHLALMQLHQLRDCYRQGWIPNWNDGTIKHCIKAKGRAVYLYTSQQTNQFLSFQTKDVADEFINNFSDLIQQAADLI